jgi:xanthine dehydrogenase FAD-binding subunit
VNVFVPREMDGLWHILENEPGAAVYAGGTDLLVRLRAGMDAPPALVCLERIGELQGIRDEGDTVFIGACTTHTALLESGLIQDALPVLHKAVRLLGSPPVRNMGTIGGNICTASPAGDTLPPLYLADGQVEVRSRAGARRMGIDRFILGPGRTALENGEVLSGVRVKKGWGYDVHHFEKVGQRKAMAISIASLAALVKTDASGAVAKIRLSWGSVGPLVVTMPEVEEALTGRPLTIDTLRSVRHLVERNVSPISDIRAGEEYRRRVASNMLLRLAEDGRRP